MNNKEIVLDIETTGLDFKDGHKIIEIGALELEDMFLTGKKFHFYINPERDIPYESYKIHGISRAFLKDKLLFKDIAEPLLEFIKDKSLIIHNAKFDIGFINYELELLGLPKIQNTIIDTLQIARQKFPGSRVNLNALCRRFKIDISSRTLHGALKDSELLAAVYANLIGYRQKSFIAADVNHSSIESLKQKVIPNDITFKPTQFEEQEHKKIIKTIKADNNC